MPWLRRHYQDVGTRDEGSSVAHQQFRHVSYFVGCTRSPGRALGEHILVEVSTWSVKFIEGKRRDDDAR